MEKSNKIQYWVGNLPKMSKIVFTQKDVADQFSITNAVNTRNASYRLVKKE
jgi:hypothetical protein